MWANAQPDGRPAEHRWRPLFSAAKFGIRELCYRQNIMLCNDYTDKLICRGYAEREGSNDDFNYII